MPSAVLSLLLASFEALAVLLPGSCTPLVLAEGVAAAVTTLALLATASCDAVYVELLLGTTLGIAAVEEALTRRSSVREPLSVVNIPFSS